MKKLSIVCAALAVEALSFTSCQKEESTTNNQQFIASFEQTGNGKASVDSDLQMYWSETLNNGLTQYIYLRAWIFESIRFRIFFK